MREGESQRERGDGVNADCHCILSVNFQVFSPLLPFQRSYSVSVRMKWTVTRCSVILHRLIGSRAMSQAIIHKDAQIGGCIFLPVVNAMASYTTAPHATQISFPHVGVNKLVFFMYTKILYSIYIYSELKCTGASHPGITECAVTYYASLVFVFAVIYF